MWKQTAFPVKRKRVPLTHSYIRIHYCNHPYPAIQTYFFAGKHTHITPCTLEKASTMHMIRSFHPSLKHESIHLHARWLTTLLEAHYSPPFIPPEHTSIHSPTRQLVVVYNKPSSLTLDIVRAVKLHMSRGRLVLLPIRVLRLQALVVHSFQRPS